MINMASKFTRQGPPAAPFHRPAYVGLHSVVVAKKTRWVAKTRPGRPRPKVKLKCTRLPEDPCQTCGHKLDAATDANGGDHAPTAGSFSVCGYCTAVTVFVEGLGGLHRRPPTVEEQAEFDSKWGEQLKVFRLRNRDRLRGFQPPGVL
jgi:hypothetical protein